MFSKLLVPLLAFLVHFATPLSTPGGCPAGVQTACASDGSATCCPIFMSQSQYGCCKISGGVCCPMSPTTQGCCPPAHSCILTGQYSAVCAPDGGGANVSATQVCTPGAKLPPSATQPSVIVVGDSVSEGYQPYVTANISDVAFVQHSPWSVGGGADDVFNGLNCEEEFMRTAMWQPAAWSLISFNFGLHDLDNSTAAEALYAAALANFTSGLKIKQPQAKLVYISTTPFMPQEYYGNMAVVDLNAIAQRIMAANGIPYLDLYHHITARCGARYSACDICDDEPAAWPTGAPPGSHCGYHYTPAGYAYITAFLAPAFRALLSA